MIIRFRQEYCPVGQYPCVCVGNKGRVISKCKYAKVTNENPETMVYTLDGMCVGARCVPSQAINFITEEI